MTTLEKAARALAFTSYKSEADDYPDSFLEDYSGATPEQLVEKFWRDWLPETRAVLMAVRDCGLEFEILDADGVKWDVPNAWTGTIEAILNDGEGD